LIQLFGCLIVTCNGDNRDVVLEGGFLSVYYSRCFFLSPQLLLGFEELRLHVSRDILLTKSACAVLVWGVRYSLSRYVPDGPPTGTGTGRLS
jgi:hypothetical protein